MVTNYQEKTAKLEKHLSRQRLKIRIIWAVLLVVFIAVAIVCLALRDASKQVTIIGEGVFAFERVEYNNYYLIGILAGFICAFFAFSFLIADIVACTFATTQANGNFITVSRGTWYSVVYINGEEAGRLGITWFAPVIEATLPDGVKVSVAFSRSIVSLARVIYSDSNKSVDL